MSFVGFHFRVKAIVVTLTALVLTGVTRRSDLPVDPAPDVVAEDLATLVGAHYS